jgi:hypothetical protein
MISPLPLGGTCASNTGRNQMVKSVIAQLEPLRPGG